MMRALADQALSAVRGDGYSVPRGEAAIRFLIREGKWDRYALERGEAALRFLIREQEWDDSLASTLAISVSAAEDEIRKLWGPRSYGGVWSGWLGAARKFLKCYKDAKGDPEEERRREQDRVDAIARESFAEAKEKSDLNLLMQVHGNLKLQDEVDNFVSETISTADPGMLVSLLVAAARNERWTVKDKAARSLKKLGVEAVPMLVAVLQDEDVAVRWSVAQLLGEIGDESAVDSLSRLLDDENEGLRDVARTALDRIRSG